MSATVKELREWLSQFGEDERIGVDEGGLTLVLEDDSKTGLKVQPQFEIGGLNYPEGHRFQASTAFADCCRVCGESEAMHEQEG